MSIALENRQERHLMRQRGAGARTITANFGFVFQAGPVQLQTPSEVREPLVAKYAPTPEKEPLIIATSEVVREDVPKKEKVARSVKRMKLDPDQQDEAKENEHTPDKGGESAPVESQFQNKKTKRKPASKRFTAPKPRQKRQTKADLQTHTTQPEPQFMEEVPQPPAPKRVQKPKAEEKPKTVATSTKRGAPKPKKQIAVEDEDEDELSNESIPSIGISKPISRERTADAMTVEAPCAGVVAKTKTNIASKKKEIDEEPVKNKATMSRKKKVATKTKGDRPVKDVLDGIVQEEEYLPGNAPESLAPPTEVATPEPIELSQEEPQNLETTKRNKRTAVTKAVKTTKERKVEVGDEALPTKNLEPLKATTKRKRDEAINEHVAEQLDVGRTDEANRGSEKVVAEPDTTVKSRKTKRAKATQDDNPPEAANVDSREDNVEASKAPIQPAKSRKRKTATSKPTQDAPEEGNREQEILEKSESTPQKTTTRSKSTRKPLSERDSNESPQKPTTDLEEKPALKASQPRAKRAVVKRSGKKPTKAVEAPAVIRVSPHHSPEPFAPIGLGITIPEEEPIYPEIVDTYKEPEPKVFKPQIRTKKTRKSIHIHEDLDLGLFDTEAPALVPKKATTARKRVFKDDDEVDLDAMLDGIAAIAENNTVGSGSKQTTKARTGRGRV